MRDLVSRATTSGSSFSTRGVKAMGAGLGLLVLAISISVAVDAVASYRDIMILGWVALAITVLLLLVQAVASNR